MTITAFSAPWWAKNRHLQTILPTLLRRRLQIDVIEEELSLPDGDFVDLAWAKPSVSLASSAPIVVVFHGLEGSIHSPYAKGILRAFQQQHWRAVLMHFRGCSGRSNRLWRGYHSGDIADAAFCLQMIKQRFPDAPIYALGYSLGGNMLANYLAHEQQNIVSAAAIISAPFQLAACADTLQKGFARFYQHHLLKRMKRNLQKKLKQHPDAPLKDAQIADWNNFIEFDQHYTAPTHGFSSAQDYYQRCSGKAMLNKIKCPCLIVHAEDDPFMDPRATPHQADLSPCIDLLLSQNGGHVGFVCGTVWQPTLWLEEMLPQWFTQQQRGLK